MDAKGKKRIVIWVSIAALLGVSGYVAYKLVKAKRDKNKAEEEAKKVAESSSSSPTSSGSSAPKPDDSSEYNSTRATAYNEKKLAFKFKGKIYVTKTGRVFSNPFKDEAQTMAFQKYVYNNLNDKSIGIPDGKWGLNTATAVLKYGTAFYNSVI